MSNSAVPRPLHQASDPVIVLFIFIILPVHLQPFLRWRTVESNAFGGVETQTRVASIRTPLQTRMGSSSEGSDDLRAVASITGTATKNRIRIAHSGGHAFGNSPLFISAVTDILLLQTSRPSRLALPSDTFPVA